MEASTYSPRTVEEVFRDFKGRRAAMIKALTTEVEDFYQQCDPEKENLCLYGFPTETWEVGLPAEEVPPELPEPALGINFARDGMQEKDWLSLVAVHSDAWLLAVAFYFGARFGFNKNDRKRLFNMINDLPTIFEVVTGTAKKPVKEKSSATNHGSNKSKSNAKVRPSETQVKYSKALHKEDDVGLEEEDEEEHGETLCGACVESYAADEFWICCDICERWYHGRKHFLSKLVRNVFFSYCTVEHSWDLNDSLLETRPNYAILRDIGRHQHGQLEHEVVHGEDGGAHGAGTELKTKLGGSAMRVGVVNRIVGRKQWCCCGCRWKWSC